MGTSQIPLADLRIQHRQVADEVRAGFDRILSDSSFVLGPQVEQFERAWATYCGTAYAVGVANGTDAIELALRACGVGEGDEVIVPANTFVATAEAVLRAGASLRLADCDENYLIDTDKVATQISRRTKAIIPVHLYGQMAPMAALREVAGDNVILIEDGAQSQGAEQNNVRSGAAGDAAATSFYPGKNLGAYGDAGAVTTSDEYVAKRLQMLRNHGGIRKYEHVEIGVNSRLDGLQAVVLSAKLTYLDEWNDERRLAAERYRELLTDVEEIDGPRTAASNRHVWHLYVVRVQRRQEVLAALREAGVGAGIHYPAPVHRLPAFAGLGLGEFPVAERLADEILSLPMFPGITEEQQERVAEVLIKAVR